MHPRLQNHCKYCRCCIPGMKTTVNAVVFASPGFRIMVNAVVLLHPRLQNDCKYCRFCIPRLQNHCKYCRFCIPGFKIIVNTIVFASQASKSFLLPHTTLGYTTVGVYNSGGLLSRATDFGSGQVHACPKEKL